jgi:hypothetical protein
MTPSKEMDIPGPFGRHTLKEVFLTGDACMLKDTASAVPMRLVQRTALAAEVSFTQPDGVLRG